MAMNGFSFEGFFNAVYKSLATDGYRHPGRTAMNAGFFQLSGPLDILYIAASCFAIWGRLPRI